MEGLFSEYDIDGGLDTICQPADLSHGTLPCKSINSHVVSSCILSSDPLVSNLLVDQCLLGHGLLHNLIHLIPIAMFTKSNQRFVGKSKIVQTVRLNWRSPARSSYGHCQHHY